jgi:hypothetical protein
MLHRIWKFCKDHKWLRLGNAIAYYHAFPFREEMIPGLQPPGLIGSKFNSFINGWCTNWSLGWIHEIEDAFTDADPNDWDIKIDFNPELVISARIRNV